MFGECIFLYFTDRIMTESSRIFEDVVEDFHALSLIQSRFQKWKMTHTETYQDAYIGLCLPKLFAPFVRLQLLDWNPLQVCRGRGEVGLDGGWRVETRKWLMGRLIRMLYRVKLTKTICSVCEIAVVWLEHLQVWGGGVVCWGVLVCAWRGWVRVEGRGAEVDSQETYQDAYIGLCLPILFAPFVRLWLLDWNPLQVCQAVWGYRMKGRSRW